MKFLQKAATTLVTSFGAISIPLAILNMLGGIVSGTWLALLGEWSPIISGIVFIIFSGFLINFALMPGMLFAVPAMIFFEKKKKILGALFGFLNILYTISLLVVWCLYILNKFTLLADNSSLIPMLIWSYGVAMAPWIFLAQKDQQDGGNEWSIFTTFFAEISYVTAMIMFYFDASFTSIAITFSAIMLVSGLIQTSIAFVIDRQTRQI